jgi:hypothetical protein
MFKFWEHKKNRIPQLDLLDLKTIIWLVENHGNRDIPLFSKRLMKKVNESMSVYQWEKELLEKSG